MTSLRSWSRALDRPGLQLDLLICAIGAVICVGLTGYFRMDLSLPASLDGDHLFFVTAAKSYVNGHGFRLDSQLGFPGERDWLYFPSFDLSSRSILWLAAHLTRNPFTVVHAYYVLGLLAMFGFAYWTLRRFGVRPWLAAVGSLASVMTPFLAARAYGHDTLAISFSVPLGLGLALSIGLGRYDGSLRRLFTDPYVVVAIVVVGTSGLYYAFYTVMLALFAAAAAGLGRRRVSPVIAAVAVSVPIFVLLVFSGFGLDLVEALSPKVAQPQRQPYEQLLYGLNLATSAYPFRFWHKVAAGVASSQAALPAVFDNEGAREWPGPFLTLVLLASPLILAVCQSRPRTPADPEEPRVRVIALCCTLILFAILFAARGGIGYLFNLMVTSAIRADARIMPFLTLAAIVVACVAAEAVSTSSRTWLRWGAPGLAAVLLLVSVRPQLWVLYKFQHATLAGNQAIRTSVPAMLRAKDRAGLKAVLELPVVSWAEQPVVLNFQPYDHQLPYDYDRPGSPTRWSYGINEKQPWFHVVEYQAADPARLDHGARQLGFDGALIAKSAYDAPSLARLQAGILGGGACRLYEDDRLALYALNGRC